MDDDTFVFQPPVIVPDPSPGLPQSKEKVVVEEHPRAKFPGNPWAAVFIAVAKVGGSYKQVAVVRDTAEQEYMRGGYTEQGRLLCMVARAISTLSDPAHAHIIRNELKLAEQAYAAQTEFIPPKTFIDNDNYATHYANRGYPSQLRVLGRGEDLVLWNGHAGGVNAAQTAATYRKRPLYPFLVHVLHQSVAVDTVSLGLDAYFVSEGPGLVINQDDYTYVTVFLDVTNPANVGYGLLARGHYLTWSPKHEEYRWAHYRKRVVLTAAAYMEEMGFGVELPEELAALERLEAAPVLHPDQMPLVNWEPFMTIKHDRSRGLDIISRKAQDSLHMHLDSVHETRICPPSAVRPVLACALRKKCVKSFVECIFIAYVGEKSSSECTLESERATVARLQNSYARSHFLTCREPLRALIYAFPHQVVASAHCCELLFLAFSEFDGALDWSCLTGVHLSTMQALLECHEFSAVGSISLCPRQIRGVSSPSQISAVLLSASSEFLAEFSLYQKPQLDWNHCTAESDDKNQKSASIAAGHEDDAVFASTIIGDLLSSDSVIKRPGLSFFFNGAHAAAATKRRWFTPKIAAKNAPAFHEHYPVSNVFVRVEVDPSVHEQEKTLPVKFDSILHPSVEFSEPNEDGNDDPKTKTPYRPVYIHTGDMLQQPGAFVAGLSRMLSSLIAPNRGGTVPTPSEESLRALPRLLAAPILIASDEPELMVVRPILPGDDFLGDDVCLALADALPAAENEAVRYRPANLEYAHPLAADDAADYTTHSYTKEPQQLTLATPKELHERHDQFLASEEEFDFGPRRRLWPHLRDLAPGSWHVVVSADANAGRQEFMEENFPYHSTSRMGVVPIVRYAFLRVNPELETAVRTDTPHDQLASNASRAFKYGCIPTGVPIFDIVGGLKEFWREVGDDGDDLTMPRELLRALRGQAYKFQAHADNLDNLPEDRRGGCPRPTEYLQTMSEGAALLAMADFVRDAALYGDASLYEAAKLSRNLDFYPEISALGIDYIEKRDEKDWSVEKARAPVVVKPSLSAPPCIPMTQKGRKKNRRQAKQAKKVERDKEERY